MSKSDQNILSPKNFLSTIWFTILHVLTRPILISGKFVTMTEAENTDARLYVDTAMFIYYLEQNQCFFQQAREFFLHCYRKIPLVTSTVTLEEYCIFPYSQNDLTTIENFHKFLDGMTITLYPVNQDIALKAARLRADHSALKALDALHLATALSADCKLFVTNDRQLQNIPEIPVMTLCQYMESKR